MTPAAGAPARVRARMPVLQRSELEASPLADLHAIASELGLEGFRALRREQLVSAILEAQGGDEEPGVEEATAVEPARAEPEAPEPEAPEPDEVPAGETLEAPAAPAPAGEEEPEVARAPAAEERIASGILDILPNGSGFVRAAPAGQSRDDAYVSPAQIRRCELRAGDEVSGPVRPPRRSERHPSLVRVERVNGGDPEPPEPRPRFGELAPVFPRERLQAPAELDGVPFGRGSRVAVAGPPGAGATTLMREIVAALAAHHPDVDVQVVLAGARPEEVPEWRDAVDAPVVGGGFDEPPEPQAQAAELAVERAKRRVERGGHAAIVVDRLEDLPAGVRRRLLGAARATEDGGTLTVVAATGESAEPLRWATTRIALEPPEPGAEAPRVSGALSGTLRADRLS